MMSNINLYTDVIENIYDKWTYMTNGQMCCSKNVMAILVVVVYFHLAFSDFQGLKEIMLKTTKHL